MGCGLHRLKRSEESSPGKVYSTLRRPQVETEVGVAYSYRFLDFLLGNAEVSGLSTPCLSSVRELPGQLQELYLQGFLLAALHPLLHSSGPASASLQRQLYRAVLIRPSNSVEQCESRRLEMDRCHSPGLFPDIELIQGYVKTVQDASEQGSVFVGFVQQVTTATSVWGQTDDEDLSLHSSPSSFLREDPDRNQNLDRNRNLERRSEPEHWGGEPEPAQEGHDPCDPCDLENQSSLNNNRVKSPGKEETTQHTGPLERVELFSLFNHMGALCPTRFYTLRVPLRLLWQSGAVTHLEAGWLDHMTQHFSRGALLVDGYFHLGDRGHSGVPPETVESVFVFQEGAESDPPTNSGFDAIVVEQWTVIHGVQVKTDYVPLLQSLALYGWRLTCVLPTPIAKSNSDGSLSTKQILFLQRPILHRKNKKLSRGSKTKSNKNCVKDVPATTEKPSERATPPP